MKKLYEIKIKLKQPINRTAPDPYRLWCIAKIGTSHKYHPGVSGVIKIIILNATPKIATNKSKFILYLCSPVASHTKLLHGDEKYWGYDEHDRIKYFMLNLHKLNASSNKIVLRPHPSESNEKYNWVIDEFGPIVSIGGKKTLLEEVMDSELVVGCNSMGLAVAIILDKRAVSSLAPDDADCTIPMKELEHLNLILWV